MEALAYISAGHEEVTAIHGGDFDEEALRAVRSVSPGRRTQHERQHG
jgi:hypothetical protein